MDRDDINTLIRVDGTADEINRFVASLKNAAHADLSWSWDRSKSPHVGVIAYRGGDPKVRENLIEIIQNRMIPAQRIAYAILTPPKGIRLVTTNYA